MSTEQEIIKKHQSVIRALIPYQQQGKLLEGLNRFSARLTAQSRQLIKDEVIRLTSQTNIPADNSAFAQFPVKRFSHFGVEMTLDKVGTEILQKETARYMEKYTVGVFESITNSAHYQGLVQRQLREKIIRAFTVQTQSYSDIEFKDDLSVSPNFSVASTAYQNGRSVGVVALSETSITVACTRSPKFSSLTNIPLQFPAIPGLNAAPEVIHYNFDGVEFNAATQRHHATLSLADQDKHWRTRIAAYLKKVMLRMPLARDLEIERAMQALDRDRIVQNSPWVPVLLAANKPKLLLQTAANSNQHLTHKSKQLLPGKVAFQRILKELSAYQDVFVLRLVIEQQGKAPVTLCSTVRQLEQQQHLAQFIQLGQEQQSLEIWQYRLTHIDKESRQTARILQDVSPQQFDDLLSMKPMLFIRNITSLIGPLQILNAPSKSKFPRQYIDNSQPYPLNYVMDGTQNQRKEPRYSIEAEATVKLSLISSVTAKVINISRGGLQLQLHNLKDQQLLPAELKVSIAEFRLKGQPYKVLYYNPSSGILRLKAITKENTSKIVSRITSAATLQTSIQNIAFQQELLFRYMWELASRHFPCAALQIVTGRQMVNRLKTLYTADRANDLHPFALSGHCAPLHGFFADLDKSPPDSTALRRLLQKAEPNHLAIHCERRSDNKLLPLSQYQCFSSSLRESIKRALQNSEISLYVAGIDCQINQSQTTPMTKQRLALLSKIDLDVYEKLLALQQNYSHVIYLADLSALFNSFMQASVMAVDEKESTADAAL